MLPQSEFRLRLTRNYRNYLLTRVVCQLTNRQEETGLLVGDGFQLGGAFLVENGRITKSFPAKDAADKVPFECLLE
jgi:hypothetical protein